MSSWATLIASTPPDTPRPASQRSAAAGGSGLPAPLMPFDAEYQVGNGTIQVGRARFELRPVDEGWLYRSRVEAEGVFSLLLGGTIDDRTWLQAHADGLRPLRFVHDEPDDEDDIAIEFDWAAGEAEVDYAGRRFSVGLQTGTHDQFSAILQALAAGEDRLQLPSIDDEGEREPLVFERAGRETIRVPLGEYETVRVRRIRENSKRETVTWFAPSLDWVVVRVDQLRKGELVGRLELVALNGERAAPQRSAGGRADP